MDVHPAYPLTGMPPPRSLTVRMDVTNRCNLDCIHCTLAMTREETGESEADMPVAVFEKIAREVFPYAHTVALSCEAEPTMHGRFLDLLAIVRSHPGPYYVMTTNGTTLTSRRIQTLLDCGMRGVNLSLDGSSEETFERIRRPGRLDKVLQGIEALVAAKRARGLGRHDWPFLQVNTTLMRSTIDELPALVERCRGWDIKRLTLQHLYEVEKTRLVDESLVFDMERSDRILQRCRELCDAYGIEQTFPPPFLGAGACSDAPSDEASPSCMAPWTMVRIRWDGTLQPCDHFGRDRMGNLAESSFEELWEDAGYGELRRQHRDRRPQHARCLTCTVVTTDNLERRPRRSPLVLMAADAPVLTTLTAAFEEGIDPWERMRRTLPAVMAEHGIDRLQVAAAVGARSWSLYARVAQGIQSPTTLFGMARACELVGEDAGIELLKRWTSATDERGWGYEERHLRLAVAAARRGHAAWANAHAEVALMMGTSMAPCPPETRGSVDGIVAHCRHAPTLSALANVRMLLGDKDGARRLFEQYLNVDPETPDAASVRPVLQRLEAECLLSQAADRLRHGDTAGSDALVRAALAIDLGQAADDPIETLPRLRFPTTCLGLAEIFTAKADHTAAARCYRAYVEMAPEAPNRAQAEARAEALEASHEAAPETGPRPTRFWDRLLGRDHDAW